MYTYINPQMSEYSIGPFPPSTSTTSRPPTHFVVVGSVTRTMGVYDDEDAVRADVDMEEEEEEIGQVRTMRRRRRGFIWTMERELDEDGDLHSRRTTLGCDRFILFSFAFVVSCVRADG